MDPEVRREAAGHLSDLFSRIGQAGQQQSADPLGDLGGLAGQVQEFVQMPMDLAVIFMNMGVGMAELVLTSLEQAGFTLVKGLTPA